MQAASPPPDKHSWRAWFRQKLGADPRPHEASAVIRQVLVEDFQSRGRQVICSFAALPGEVDLLPLLTDLPDCLWCFPRVEGENLRFHHVTDASQLIGGTMGILEPPAELPLVEPSRFDVVLCPGLGFGRDGSRLGRGRGFYDRTLSECRGACRLLGITLPHQLVDALPTEEHDRFMNQLVTIDGFLDCPGKVS